jgi:heat shock protein HslJ
MSTAAASTAVAGFRLALLALLVAACTSIAVDARTFDGTRWRVAAIDGRFTPALGDYRVEFKDGGIGGRFGCNGFGGRYAVAGDLLTASEIRSTMMACSDPAASFESAGFAVLKQPMRINWSSGRRLALSNSAGSIELERVP